MNIYTPWLISVVSAALIVSSRLITNRQLDKTGRIPTWLSLFYMIGIIGMIMAAFLSLGSIGWWGPIPIVLLYFAIGFVKSELFARDSGIVDSQHKKLLASIGIEPASSDDYPEFVTCMFASELTSQPVIKACERFPLGERSLFMTAYASYLKWLIKKEVESKFDSNLWQIVNQCMEQELSKCMWYKQEVMDKLFILMEKTPPIGNNRGRNFNISLGPWGDVRMALFVNRFELSDAEGLEFFTHVTLVSTNILEVLRLKQTRNVSEYLINTVLIEDILKGVASGHYPNKSGSHFCSRWRKDGLFVAEASHDEYSQFLGGITAPAIQAKDIKLCHGKPIMWMGEEWSTILTYYRSELSVVDIVTQKNKNIDSKVKVFIEGIFDQGKRFGRDSTMREFEWIGIDGAIALTVTSKMVQISINKNLK